MPTVIGCPLDVLAQAGASPLPSPRVLLEGARHYVVEAIGEVDGAFTMWGYEVLAPVEVDPATVRAFNDYRPIVRTFSDDEQRQLGCTQAQYRACKDAFERAGAAAEAKR